MLQGSVGISHRICAFFFFRFPRIRGLFHLIQQLFGVRWEKATARREVPMWHRTGGETGRMGHQLVSG